MSWVTCDPKSTIKILSWPASRSEPAPRTSEESRMVIQTYVRPGGPPVKALDTVHHSLKRLFPRDGGQGAGAGRPGGGTTAAGSRGGGRHRCVIGDFVFGGGGGGGGREPPILGGLTHAYATSL